MAVPFYIPATSGTAALQELDRVPWESLQHAYGSGAGSGGLHEDVEGSLGALAAIDSFADGVSALYSNICHQGTVYEATAHAVPFLAAVAAGTDLTRKKRLELVDLLGEITLSSSFVTEDGTSSGAYGDDTSEAIRAALTASAARIKICAEQDSLAAAVVRAMLAVIAADPVTVELFEALREEVDDLEARLADLEDDEPSALPVATARYRHAKFGAATLISRQENGLRLRFDDGIIRVIQERFLRSASD